MDCQDKCLLQGKEPESELGPEIRPLGCGEKAQVFVADLFQQQKYCERNLPESPCHIPLGSVPLGASFSLETHFHFPKAAKKIRDSSKGCGICFTCGRSGSFPSIS